MKSFIELIGIELNAVSCKEKIVCAIGGLLSIGSLVWIAHHSLGVHGSVCFIASMGASAVLLFAVPHGQLSQPWPVLAGHVLSATTGVLCARFLGHDWIASGAAVAISIGLMHQLKCIHPPGGATALTAVLGGPAVYDLGFEFVWSPVLLNALIMLAIAVVFNWPFAWRRYPATSVSKPSSIKPHPLGRENHHEDIIKALRSLDSFVDVTESDLMTLAVMIAREREARMLREERKSAALLKSG